MFYCVSIMMLGYTRINGVVAYSSETRSFEEITPAAARQLLAKNKLKGVKWKNNENEGGSFVCDTEGWNQQNIPIKTACGKFRPMLNDVPGIPNNSMYTVVRVLDTNYRGRLFEIVSNKCARIKVQEEQLRKLAEITNVAGVWITDNEITLAEGINYEDRRENESTTSSGTGSTLMDEIFGQQDENDGFMKVPEQAQEQEHVEEPEPTGEHENDNKGESSEKESKEIAGASSSKAGTTEKKGSSKKGSKKQ